MKVFGSNRSHSGRAVDMAATQMTQKQRGRIELPRHRPLAGQSVTDRLREMSDMAKVLENWEVAH